jgi:hypothetical protein
MAANRKAGAGKKALKKKGSSRAASGKDALKIIDAYLQTKNPTLKKLAGEFRRLIFTGRSAFCWLERTTLRLASRVGLPSAIRRGCSRERGKICGM